jgi:predicted hotdog family 3-hydroxylacyl-ACP dehydratase
LTRSVVDVAGLLPQAGHARMVDSVVELREDGIVCAGRISPEHPLVRGGRVAGFVGLELAAQAAAVFEALRRRALGGEAAARVGLLVSLRDVRLELAELSAGTRLVASIRAVGSAAALSLYEARVFEGGALALEGTLGTYLPPLPGPKGAGAR